MNAREPATQVWPPGGAKIPGELPMGHVGPDRRPRTPSWGLLPPSSSVVSARWEAAPSATLAGPPLELPPVNATLFDLRMLDQGGARRKAVSCHQVDHARGKADLLEQRHQFQQRTPRRAQTGLHHDRAARRPAQAPASIAASCSGEFQGMIAPTTPIGSPQRVVEELHSLWITRDDVAEDLVGDAARV